MTHSSVNPRRTHSLICAPLRTHTQGRARTRTTAYAHGALGWWRPWEGGREGGRLRRRGVPDQSAPGPLILRWRASGAGGTGGTGGTGAPGRSGTEERKPAPAPPPDPRAPHSSDLTRRHERLPLRADAELSVSVPSRVPAVSRVHHLGGRYHSCSIEPLRGSSVNRDLLLAGLGTWKARILGGNV
ncbi:hypothetical protein FQA47_023262 [Oryzias melastigma]|uniref:Uncharacterized protein n=1 Tax=Oryzias melastigma TaxID=30732 RepID=A0A834F292_ORYME|nr:hypothetical protein FQA47_023262 [Oryzias melastigma]